MRDDTLVEPFGVEEIYVDGFFEHVIIGNGNVMTCLGYRTHSRPEGETFKVARVRLIWPAVATDDAIADARQAQGATVNLHISESTKRH